MIGVEENLGNGYIEEDQIIQQEYEGYGSYILLSKGIKILKGEC